MRLYRKQLNSLEELRREKAALLLLRKKTEEENLFDPKDLVPSFTKKDKGHSEEQTSDNGDILDMLKGVAGDIGIANLLPLILNPLEALAGKKLREKVLLPLAKEMLGGYLKWKAVELGLKALKHFAKKSRKKKRAARSED